MRGETVITTCVGTDVFPQRAGSIGHVEQIGDRFVENLAGFATRPRQQLHAKHVADERIGRMNLGKSLGLLAFRAKLIKQ